MAMDPEKQPNLEEEVTTENSELILFQTEECYVYMIPPRRSSASYRADEWNVNKWAWEGALRIISRGDECFIRLEDRKTGELYAQAFVRRDQPLPVEPVIDSSRYFVLCIEETFGGKTRHAFIGIGFRERAHAYDFQAALYDHVKYLNKKKAAEEMEQQFQAQSSIDYSLKEGQTLKLQLKTASKGQGLKKSIFFEKNFDNTSAANASEQKAALPCLTPPPPPPQATMTSSSAHGSPVSPLTPTKEPSELFANKDAKKACEGQQNDGFQQEDEFGDFQGAS